MAKNRIFNGNLSRREVLKCGLYGGLGLGLPAGLLLNGCGKGKRGRSKANVLVIVLDTARADRFSFAGYSRNTSPNIDALADGGVVYERAYAPAFWTLPSHASLFTGLYPSQAGATSETNILPYANVTIAELLKNAGYSTAGFSCNVWVSKERGFAKGFDEFYEMWRPENHSQVPQQPGWPERAAFEKVVTWLGQKQTTKNPFFAFVNLNCAHLPYYPPEPFRGRFVKSDYSEAEVGKVAGITELWEFLAGKLKLNETEFRIMSDLYDGEIAFADYCVGQIVDCLRAGGVLDETMVVVTSDHGENLGEHGLIDHVLSMYETTLHIPLVIRHPEYFGGGVRINEMASLLDIAPTILDLCGVGFDDARAMSQASSLIHPGRTNRRFVIAENERPINGIEITKTQFPSFDTKTIDHRMRAIRTDGHKLIWKIGDGTELYDLRADPKELRNIADSDSQTRDKLRKTLRLCMEKIPSAGDVTLLESQDAESLEILRSLGYVK